MYYTFINHVVKHSSENIKSYAKKYIKQNNNNLISLKYVENNTVKIIYHMSPNSIYHIYKIIQIIVHDMHVNILRNMNIVCV